MVFDEALRRLDRLRDLASGIVQNPVSFLEDVAKEAAFDDVVHLRRTIIEATRRTEVDRARLDATAQTDAAAKASLASLQSRLQSVAERIDTTERHHSDQHRRLQLEQANSRLSKTKKRVNEKRELLEQREKKLREFQELSTPLKFGTPTRISAYDDEERLEAALATLPRPLASLFGQLSTAKTLFGVPVELGLVPKPHLPSVSESGRSEMEVSGTEPPAASKKQRLSDRKVKHGAEEKRRKRWYEELMGEDCAVSYEDWITPQRTLSNSLLHQNSSNSPEAKSETQQRYELLMEIAEAARRQSATKKQMKRRKQSSLRSIAEPGPRFPLPVPQGELSVEVKFLNGEEEIAVLTFSWLESRVFVQSSPDWLLSQTVKLGDHSLDWEQGKRTGMPRNYRAVTSTYGYPFQWAQELCGKAFLKPPDSGDVLYPTELQEMNQALIQQQEFILEFLQRVQSQAMDLKAYRYDSAVTSEREGCDRNGVESMKNEARRQKRDGTGPHFIQFHQIPLHKRTPQAPVQLEQTSHHGLASGSWAVILKKEPAENGNETPERTTAPMEVDGVPDPKQPIQMRFYPYCIKDFTQHCTLSKSEIFYEVGSPSVDASQFSFTPFDKLRAQSNDSPIPNRLIGPLGASEIGSRSDLVYGQLVVQKGVKVPKRYTGVLPVDYQTRFFPFELRSRRAHFPPLPTSHSALYRFYRVRFQQGHIRLSAMVCRSLGACHITRGGVDEGVFDEAVVSSGVDRGRHGFSYL